MELRGLEIFHSAVSGQLQKKADCLVAAIHMILINKGLKCIGKGDEFPADGKEQPSEMLPDGWNSDPEVYSLRYVSRSGCKFLVKIITEDKFILINVFNDKDSVAAGMSVNVDRHIPDDFREFTGNYLNMEELIHNFGKEIARNIRLECGNPDNQDRSEESSSKEGNRNRSPRDPEHENRDPRQQTPPILHQPVGSRDLDPLGRGRGGPGGGMLMDPESMGCPTRPTLPELGVGSRGGLPRGSVPPGARFDPIGPPSRRGPPARPNPDHLQPPDADENMDYIG